MAYHREHSLFNIIFIMRNAAHVRPRRKSQNRYYFRRFLVTRFLRFVSPLTWRTNHVQKLGIS
jgi:hypothetical protein